MSSGRNQQYLVPANSNFGLQFLYVETALVAANYILQIVFLCILYIKFLMAYLSVGPDIHAFTTVLTYIIMHTHALTHTYGHKWSIEKLNRPYTGA